jgi:hypothetical protein
MRMNEFNGFTSYFLVNNRTNIWICMIFKNVLYILMTELQPFQSLSAVWMRKCI